MGVYQLVSFVGTVLIAFPCSSLGIPLDSAGFAPSTLVPNDTSLTAGFGGLNNSFLYNWPHTPTAKYPLRPSEGGLQPYPGCELELMNVQPTQYRQFGGMDFRLATREALDDLLDWVISARSGTGNKVRNHAARHRNFKWGDHGRYNAWIFAIWHTIDEDHITKQVARDTIRDMNLWIMRHVSADYVALELWYHGAPGAVLKIHVDPGDRNGLGESAATAGSNTSLGLSPWPIPPVNRWKLYGHPECEIAVLGTNPLQESLVGIKLAFLSDDVLTALQKWSQTPEAGSGPGVVQYQKVTMEKFKFGNRQKHTGEIFAAWLPVHGTQVPKEVAKATVEEMRVLFAIHGSVQSARLELLQHGSLMALVKLGIVTDEHADTEEIVSTAK